MMCTYELIVNRCKKASQWARFIFILFNFSKRFAFQSWEFRRDIISYNSVPNKAAVSAKGKKGKKDAMT